MWRYMVRRWLVSLGSLLDMFLLRPELLWPIRLLLLGPDVGTGLPQVWSKQERDAFDLSAR